MEVAGGNARASGGLVYLVIDFAVNVFCSTILRGESWPKYSFICFGIIFFWGGGVCAELKFDKRVEIRAV